MKRLLIFVVVIAMCLAGPAASRRPTVHVIRHDNGGNLVRYIGRFVGWDNNGDYVRIEGPCMSACTLMLGALDNSRICATAYGQFGFHSASEADEYSLKGTELMWFFYSSYVRSVMRAHGWGHPSYHPQFLMIDAQEIVRACE